MKVERDWLLNMPFVRIIPRELSIKKIYLALLIKCSR